MRDNINSTYQPEMKDNFTTGENQDLARFVRRIMDKWYLFVLGIFTAILIALAINKFSHPVYNGNTTLLLRSDQQQPLGAESLVRDLSFNVQDNIRNEIGILKSHTLSRRTLEALDFEISYFSIPRWMGNWRLNALATRLYHDVPIVVTTNNDTAQLKEVPFYIRILSGKEYLLHFDTTINDRKVAQTDTFNFGQPIRSPNFAFTVNLRNKYAPELFDPESSFFGFDYSFMMRDIEKLASQYSNNLKIDFYFDDASILDISLSGPHPEMVAAFLNQHTKTFIESGLEEKNIIATATIDFIDRQISGISDSLQEAESDFQRFRSQNQLINISSEGNYAMEKMERLVSQKSNLQRMSKYYDYLFDYIQNQNEFNDVIVPSTMGISDQSLNSLVARLSETYSTRSRLLMTARKSSPQVQQITSAIESIRQALLENVRNIINTTNIEVAEIEKQIEEVNKEIRRLPGTEREYINIQRNFQLNDNIYTFL
jgi:tyrosine-protein kinase Etk/Wzc